MRRIPAPKVDPESDDWQGRRLSWVCVHCGEPCGDHPRARVGAMVRGDVVNCFDCERGRNLRDGAGI